MLEMTATMECCLAAVLAEQGQPARDLPGGVGTVWALMRRGLVETDTEKGMWRVFTPAHEHEFETTLHLDGCHYWTTAARCECGVIYGVRAERSFTADSYAASESDCPRCEALRNGVRPQTEVVIQRPRSYTPPLEVIS
jgi:hypothetical protein